MTSQRDAHSSSSTVDPCARCSVRGARVRAMGSTPSKPEIKRAPNGAPLNDDGTPKKMCCACPTTKKARDECVVMQGEESGACDGLIEAHLKCLRAEGFDV